MSSILFKTAATAAHKTMPIPFKPCKLQGLFGGHGLADPWAYWGYLSLFALSSSAAGHHTNDDDDKYEEDENDEDDEAWSQTTANEGRRFLRDF